MVVEEKGGTEVGGTVEAEAGGTEAEEMVEEVEEMVEVEGVMAAAGIVGVGETATVGVDS